MVMNIIVIKWEQYCFINLENLNGKTETLNHVFPLILNQLYVNPCLHFIINIAFITLVSRCQIIFKNGKLKIFNFQLIFFLI